MEGHELIRAVNKELISCLVDNMPDPNASAMCKQVDEAESLSTLLEKVLREARLGLLYIRNNISLNQTHY